MSVTRRLQLQFASDPNKQNISILYQAKVDGEDQREGQREEQREEQPAKKKDRRPFKDVCCQCLYEIFVEDMFQCEEEEFSLYTRDTRATYDETFTHGTSVNIDDDSITSYHRDEGYNGV